MCHDRSTFFVGRSVDGCGRGASQLTSCPALFYKYIINTSAGSSNAVCVLIFGRPGHYFRPVALSFFSNFLVLGEDAFCNRDGVFSLFFF